MKRICLIVFALLICVSLFFAGCQTEMKDYLNLSQDGSANYVIVNLLPDKDAATKLAKHLKSQSGAVFNVVDTPTEGTKAIYLGVASDLIQYGLSEPSLKYTEYQVSVSDDNIFVAMTDAQYAEEVVAQMTEQIDKVSDGQAGMDKAWIGSHNVAQISESVPEFNTAKGTLYDVHDSGNGNFLLTYENVASVNEPINYEYTLIDAGYALTAVNEIGDNRFVTYIKGDTLIHCTYFAAVKEYRIVYGPKTYLGNLTPVENYKTVTTPSVTMIGLTDSALCMVVQLADGSFIVIDGGWNQSMSRVVTLNAGTSSEKLLTYKRDVDADMEELHKFLTENAPAGTKPQVTWMITHPDIDHIGLPTLFINKYADSFTMNTVCYNFPNMHNIRFGEGGSNQDPDTYTAQINAFLKACNTNFPNANHYTLHTGLKMYLPGCEIEFLFTASEDYYPKPMYWGNQTCNAWRMTIEGKTIFFTGDVEEGLCNKMATCYGDYLKSDILQVVHHGSNGATLPFYQCIKPSMCFWPCKDEYLQYDLRHTGVTSVFNKYLHDVADRHYSHSNTTTILLPSLEEKK